MTNNIINNHQTNIKPILINIILFKIGWVSVVFGASYNVAWLGTLVVVVITIIHLATTAIFPRELALLITAAIVGLLWESMLVSQGVLIYTNHTNQIGLAPYWIVAMWILFATTFNVSLRWLKTRPAVALAFGGIGGPLSFFSGQHIGAVSFPNTTVALIIISLGWATLLPLMMWISNHFDGHPSC